MNELLQNQSIQNILLGVAGNMLTSLLAMSARGAHHLLVGAEKSTLFDANDLIRSATNTTSDEFTWNGPGKVEEVCLFLSSPESENIVRQFFSATLVGHGRETRVQIEDEFTSCLALFLDVPKQTLDPHAQQLFTEVASACEAMLAAAISQGILGAHETKSALRHNILLDELAAIKKNVGFLARQPVSVAAITAFETRYRSQVNDRHADIVPPNLDAAQRIPIDELYVPPHLIRVAREKDDENESLNIDGLRRVLKRGVLLGNPGGGKSTLAQKFVHDLTSRHPRRAGSTPILVVLRDYGAAKKEKHYSLLQFIEMTANATYQVEPPAGAFEYMLLNGRAVVVFDGLDELLDTSHRQDIARDIELFCNVFPNVRILVTSRQVGYEQAPLDPQRFDTFLLEPFTDEQVQDYVKKWFQTDRDLTLEQQAVKASAFYRESRIVSDLCTNPLMLALMCNIYRGENYIPSNRPDVYEKCALMLFDRWDKGRGIRVPLPIDAHVRPAMMDLAHWIYADEALQSGVTEQRLIRRTTNYLCPRRFEDRDEAANAARQFIEFCRGRAWVFTDTGTTREGERLYQFTHRTFLEYFTAAQLVRTNPTPDRLLPVLLPRIAKREWDVVAQLAFQIQNKNVEGAGDELLIKLRDVAGSNRSDPWSYLSFATRCLEFIIPTPRTCRELTLMCVDLFLAQPPRQPGASRDAETANPREAMAGLMFAAVENHKVVLDTLESDLIERIRRDGDLEASKAAEFALHLQMSVHVRRRVSSRATASEWRQVSQRIAETTATRLSELAEGDLRVAIDVFRRGQWPISRLLDRYGARALFRPVMYRVFQGARSGPIGEWILMHVMDGVLREQSWDRKRTLTGIGAWLLKAEKPVTKTARMSTSSWARPFGVQEPSPPLESRLEDDEVFAAFALFAVYVEAAGAEWRIDPSDFPAYGRTLLERFTPLFEMREQTTAPEDVRSLLRSFPFNAEQDEFIIAWATREMNLIERAPEASRTIPTAS